MQSFSCTHKPRMPKDRDVCVFYYPYKNGLTLNTAASSLFKMQIYGDVLLVQQTTMELALCQSPQCRCVRQISY
jgi:hypothetical protein